MTLRYPPGDLRNIFDIANAFSEAQAAERKRRDELDVLRNLSRRECGNCDKWMKSRECPREHNVKGMSRGPSCKGLACGSFVGRAGFREAADKLAAELEKE